MNPTNPTGNNQPGGARQDGADAQAAVNMIRQKIAQLYRDEPDAAQEMAEADNAPRRSKHQQFMRELSVSGKDLATIQTEWHNYYQSLTDAEKHEVWREFYASQPLLAGQPRHGSTGEAQMLAQHKHQAVKPRPARKPRDTRGKSEIQAAIRRKVSAGGRLKAKHHIQSVLFGLGMGCIVLLIFLFGFFNEVVIAPFIQPSRVSGDAPLIVSSNSVATSTPEVIIPKINVQIPVIYTETSTDENVIESDLQDGVVHYPTTVLPGQLGNAAFFGHSSNNIFNQGKYKFAFVLLHELQPGDTFYLSYNKTMYVYKVISRTIVDPSQVGVLGPVPGQKATATLITCDPPGTSLHRLIVVGEQISPDPAGNSAPAVSSTPIQPASLPGNGPTLWTRFISTLVGKITTVVVLVLIGWYIIRWVNRRIDALET